MLQGTRFNFKRITGEHLESINILVIIAAIINLLIIEAKVLHLVTGLNSLVLFNTWPAKLKEGSTPLVVRPLWSFNSKKSIYIYPTYRTSRRGTHFGKFALENHYFRSGFKITLSLTKCSLDGLESKHTKLIFLFCRIYITLFQ